MSKVHAGQVASENTQEQAPVLPERVQVVLGESVGAAREGLLALSVGVGLGVMHESDGRGGRRGCVGRAASTTLSESPTVTVQTMVR